VVQNLLHGRYGQPLRVIALNVDEGWSQDVSEAMAHKVREIAEHKDYELTQGTLDFIDAGKGRNGHPHQLMERGMQGP
jgi:tRNA(Ile)-lysidine synthase TilS/MesJ